MTRTPGDSECCHGHQVTHGVPSTRVRFSAIAILVVVGSMVAACDSRSPAEHALEAAAPSEYAAWQAARRARLAALDAAPEEVASRQTTHDHPSLVTMRVAEAIASMAATAAGQAKEHPDLLAGLEAWARAKSARERMNQTVNDFNRGRFRTIGEGSDAMKSALANMSRALDNMKQNQADFEIAHEAAEKAEEQAEIMEAAANEARSAARDALEAYTEAGTGPVLAYEAAVKAEETSLQRLKIAAPEAWEAFDATQPATVALTTAAPAEYALWKTAPSALSKRTAEFALRLAAPEEYGAAITGNQSRVRFLVQLKTSAPAQYLAWRTSIFRLASVVAQIEETIDLDHVLPSSFSEIMDAFVEAIRAEEEARSHLAQTAPEAWGDFDAVDETRTILGLGAIDRQGQD